MPTRFPRPNTDGMTPGEAKAALKRWERQKVEQGRKEVDAGLAYDFRDVERWLQRQTALGKELPRPKIRFPRRRRPLSFTQWRHRVPD